MEIVIKIHINIQMMYKGAKVMSVDLSKVEIPERSKDGDYPVVPNGDHVAEIFAEEKTSSNGNEMMACQFKTDKGVVFNNFVLNNEHGLIRLKILCKAIGVTNYEEVHANDLHGKKVIITTEEKWSDFSQKNEAQITYGGFKSVDSDSQDPEDAMEF